MRLSFGLGLALSLWMAAPAAAQLYPVEPAGLVPQSTAPPAAISPMPRPRLIGYEGDPVEEQPVLADPGLLGGCGVCDDCAYGCYCDKWFGSVAGLVMGRDNPNAFWTTYESNNNPNQLLNTKDASADWAGGAEFRVGRWIDCGCLSSGSCDSRNGIQVVYFFLGNMNGFASVSGADVAAGTVSTTIDLQDPTTPSGNVEIGGTDSAFYFDGASEQRIYRSDQVHNLELNFINQRLAYRDIAQITWLAGVRYFRFDESLIYGSVADGFNFGDNGGADEAYLSIRSQNNLIGPQVGVRLDYPATETFGLFFEPKFGIYANQVSTRAHLYSGDGLQGYDIYGDDTDFSILLQFDAGVNYQFARNWRAFLGYRVIAVSGITLSDNQMPHYLAATDELAVPDTNGSLILHGGTAGLEFRY